MLLLQQRGAMRTGFAACAVQVRDELIDAVCKREMGVYTQIFSTMGETAKLERTVNRWASGLVLSHPGLTWNSVQGS